MDRNKFKLCSVEEIREAMTEFKKLKELNDYSQIREKFFDLFEVFPMSIMFNDTHTLKHLQLYRACPADKVLEWGKSNLASYMGPPKFKDVGKGRANWNGRNVFYAGDSPYVTVVENKKLTPGKEYYIGQWEIDVEKITEKQIPISYLTLNNLSKENPWNNIIPSKEEMKERLIDNFKIEQKVAEFYVEMISELSTLFVEDNESYNLSAFIADNILYSNNNEKHMPKILIYPSVESNKNSCNLAINPDFAIEYLSLKKVVKIKVSEVQENSFKAAYRQIGQIELGKIQYYHFNFDRDKARYKIDSLQCRCGTKFKIKDFDKVTMVENNVTRSLKELIDRESRKWVKEEDLVEYEKAIFETNGIAIRKVLEVTIPLPDTTFDYVKKQHSALFCEISIEQPFDYIKENNILVGMKPLVEYKPLDKKHPLIKDYRTQVL
jgi:hypothetical protein